METPRNENCAAFFIGLAAELKSRCEPLLLRFLFRRKT
jgi:hypothetical protein